VGEASCGTSGTYASADWRGEKEEGSLLVGLEPSSLRLTSDSPSPDWHRFEQCSCAVGLEQCCASWDSLILP
jgi:hypothetical protein